MNAFMNYGKSNSMVGVMLVEYDQQTTILMPFDWKLSNFSWTFFEANRNNWQEESVILRNSLRNWLERLEKKTCCAIRLLIFTSKYFQNFIEAQKMAFKKLCWKSRSDSKKRNRTCAVRYCVSLYRRTYAKRNKHMQKNLYCILEIRQHMQSNENKTYTYV